MFRQLLMCLPVCGMLHWCINKLCGRLSQSVPPPASWPLTLKVISESRVTWATSVPILVFLGPSVLDLGPMYATDVRRASSLNAPYSRGEGIIKVGRWGCMASGSAAVDVWHYCDLVTFDKQLNGRRIGNQIIVVTTVYVNKCYIIIILNDTAC